MTQILETDLLVNPKLVEVSQFDLNQNCGCYTKVKANIVCSSKTQGLSGVSGQHKGSYIAEGFENEMGPYYAKGTHL